MVKYNKVPKIKCKVYLNLWLNKMGNKQFKCVNLVNVTFRGKIA